MPAIFDGLFGPDRPASVSLRHLPLVGADFVTLPQMTRRDYTPALFSLSASAPVLRTAGKQSDVIAFGD